MKIENSVRKQMELALPHTPQPVRRRRVYRGIRRREKAGWWFREMHRVVDETIGWTARPGTCPTQEILIATSGS